MYGTNSQAGSNVSNWTKNGFGQGCPGELLKGKFSPKDSLLVRDSVLQYCAAHDISPARLCSLNRDSELRGAWVEIARALPHRTVKSVYCHGLRQFHPFQRGPWNDEECSRLHELVETLGKKWSRIQFIINRSADSCIDKYREMSSMYVKGRWKKEEIELMLRLLSELLKLPPLSRSDAQNVMAGAAVASTRSKLPLEIAAQVKHINDKCEAEGIPIPWSAVSKRMVNRSRLSCFKKWQKMSGKDNGDEDVRPLPVVVHPGCSAVSPEQLAAVQIQLNHQQHQQMANVVAESIDNIPPVVAATRASALDAPLKVVSSKRGQKRVKKEPDAIEGNTANQSISSQPQTRVKKEDQASSDFPSGPLRDTTPQKKSTG